MAFDFNSLQASGALGSMGSGGSAGGGSNNPNPFAVIAALLTGMNFAAPAAGGLFGIGDVAGGIFKDVQIFKGPQTKLADGWKKGGQDVFSNISPPEPTPIVASAGGSGFEMDV